MRNQSQAEPPDGDHGAGLRLSSRQIMGGIVAILLVVFIAANNANTTISVVFFKVTLPLWVVLAVTTLLGVGIGMLLGSRRTRRKYANP